MDLNFATIFEKFGSWQYNHDQSGVPADQEQALPCVLRLRSIESLPPSILLPHPTLPFPLASSTLRLGVDERQRETTNLKTLIRRVCVSHHPPHTGTTTSLRNAPCPAEGEHHQGDRGPTPPPYTTATQPNERKCECVIQKCILCVCACARVT